LDAVARNFVFPKQDVSPESFGDYLSDKHFRQVVASKYHAYSAARRPFQFMKALLLADIQAFADTQESAHIFNALIPDFLSRFELAALDVLLEGLSQGIPTKGIYQLDRLPTPLLDVFIVELERRSPLNETVDALEKALQLFRSAKHKRLADLDLR
jgi:hypothetical protein